MGLMGFFKCVGGGEVGREIGEFGERLEEGFCALLAGETCESQSFIMGVGDLVEEAA